MLTRLFPPSFLPILALLAATLFWGSSFLTVSVTLEHTNPLALTTMRFVIGALMTIPILGARVLAISRQTWRDGFWCALPISIGYCCNAWGLISLPSSESGFLMALYVPFTPMLMWFVYGKAPSRANLIGVTVAFFGLVLLANPTSFSLASSTGQLITIISAFLSAIEILVVGRMAPRNPPRELAFAQLVGTALMSGVVWATFVALDYPLTETVFNGTVIRGILWLATIVAGVQLLLSWAQRTVPPDRAAIIFSMESVFSAIIGFVAGERLGWMGLTGGAMIVLAVFVGETKLVPWLEAKWLSWRGRA